MLVKKSVCIMNDKFSFDFGLERIIIFSLFPIGIDCFKKQAS